MQRNKKLGLVSEFLNKKHPVYEQWVIAVLTGCELVVGAGVVLNVWMGWTETGRGFPWARILSCAACNDVNICFSGEVSVCDPVNNFLIEIWMAFKS